MNKQMTKTAAMLMLVIGLMTSAVWAQDETSLSPQPFIYTGVETAKGTFEANTKMVYGNNFILHSYDVMDRSYKGIIYHFTISLNNSGEINNENDNSTIKDGSWSLVVYRDNAYIGTLFGEVEGGSIHTTIYGKKGKGSKQMQVKLKATGGLGTFAEQGSKNMSGVFRAITDLSTKQTTGIIDISCEDECIKPEPNKDFIPKPPEYFKPKTLEQ